MYHLSTKDLPLYNHYDLCKYYILFSIYFLVTPNEEATIDGRYPSLLCLLVPFSYNYLCPTFSFSLSFL